MAAPCLVWESWVAADMQPDFVLSRPDGRGLYQAFDAWSQAWIEVPELVVL